MEKLETYIFSKALRMFFIWTVLAILQTTPVLTGFAQNKPQPSEAEFWNNQRAKSNEERAEPVGLDIEGLEIPSELSTGTKQFGKLRELIRDTGFKMPMDFADLALRRARGDLVDVPLVTDNYLVDSVGGSATDAVFTGYNFSKGSTKLSPARLKILSALAKNFGGRKYDLKKADDRRQMRRALLRMLSPQTKILLEELAAEYKEKFGRPLRVTSLARSMDYQVELNRHTPDSYRVTGPLSTPPHVGGFAFDITFRHMTAEEQNFLMKKIAELEREDKIDGLREEGTSQVFHIFVYPDGKPAQKQ